MITSTLIANDWHYTILLVGSLRYLQYVKSRSRFTVERTPKNTKSKANLGAQEKIPKFKTHHVTSWDNVDKDYRNKDCQNKDCRKEGGGRKRRIRSEGSWQGIKLLSDKMA
eukprot:5014135-Pyramimonas_sp.AAC.1